MGVGLLVVVWMMHALIQFSATNEDIITLGVLLPSLENVVLLVDLYRILPGIHIAVETVNNNYRLVGNRTLKVEVANSRCAITHGSVEAMSLYNDHHVHAFIGPVCEIAARQVSLYSADWGVPVVTGGGEYSWHDTVDKGEDYRMLTRVGYSHYKVAYAIRALFERYKWYRYTSILYEKDTISLLMLKEIDHILGERWREKYPNDPGPNMVRFNFTEKVTLDSIRDYNWSSIILTASKRARVVLLFGWWRFVRQIMRHVSLLNLHHGDYVFLHIDPKGSFIHEYKNWRKFPWYDPDATMTVNREMRRAYETLFTMTFRLPDSPRYGTFTEEVKRRYKALTNNAHIWAVNTYPAVFHDAVLLYAHALNETLKAGISGRDAEEVTRRMWNRTIEGITGTVTMDGNGDRDADFSLLDLDRETGNFEVVANYLGPSRVLEFVAGKGIHWGGNRSAEIGRAHV